jgi:hypothetical protein
MSEKVKMKAVDTLHHSSASQHSIPGGGHFEVSEADAADLEKRGLATRVKDAGPAPRNKDDGPAPKNKSARKAK